MDFPTDISSSRDSDGPNALLRQKMMSGSNIDSREFANKIQTMFLRVAQDYEGIDDALENRAPFEAFKVPLEKGLNHKTPLTNIWSSTNSLPLSEHHSLKEAFQFRKKTR